MAVSAIRDFLIDHDLDVTLVVYDKSAFTVSRELLAAVGSYIDEHYIETHEIRRRKLLDAERQALREADGPVRKSLFKEPDALDDLVGSLDEPFSRMLLRLIDARGMTDVEVYKRANLDRKLFSKIRSNKGYMPSKRTAIAFAVALELSLSETDEFLQRAGYALSRAVKFDVIIEYFIANGKYDVFGINEVLFEYDQPLLGG